MLTMHFLVLSVLAGLCIYHEQSVDGARILGVFSYPSKSHFMVSEALMEGLAKAGHEVVVASYFPRTEPLEKYTDIDISGTVELKLNSYNVDHWSSLPRHRVYIEGIWGGSVERCRLLLKHPSLQKLIHSTTEKFDLFITEIFGSECLLGFSHKFQVPTVVVFTSMPFPWNTDPFGNPDNPAYVPRDVVETTGPLNFLERLSNTVNSVLIRIGFRYYSDTPSNEIAKEHFGESLPPLSDIARNTSLLLLNTHFSINPPRPWMPAIREIGGIHIKPPKPLPKDLELFINGAKHGVIYFSMGSMIRAESFPQDKRKALLEAFSELPQRVLWKWEGESLPGQHDNIKIGKWMPQNDILSHRNVKLFITHGGLLGVMEAIHYGVPMVGIPIYGDQNTNMQACVSNNIAVQLEFTNMTKENILAALREVIYNSSYRESSRHLSRVFRDRPETPLQSAIFWTEYVLRYGGARHLRSLAADLPLYQYLLLDVIAFLGIAVAAAFIIPRFIIMKSLSILFKTKSQVKPISSTTGTSESKKQN